MEKKEFVNLLMDLILDHDSSQIENMEEEIIDYIESYEQAMILTGNEGFVVKLNDGSEFQVTVVKSK